jgi:hypothetical protein
MDFGKLLVWLVLAVVALAVLNAVVAAVFAAIGFLWWLVSTAVTLAVVGALLYGGYRLYSLVSGDSKGYDTSSEYGLDTDSSLSDVESSLSRSETSGTGTEYGSSGSSVDDLQRQYAEGDISEAELERRLERQMADDELDSIDRELQRERR